MEKNCCKSITYTSAKRIASEQRWVLVEFFYKKIVKLKKKLKRFISLKNRTLEGTYMWRFFF